MKKISGMHWAFQKNICSDFERGQWFLKIYLQITKNLLGRSPNSLPHMHFSLPYLSCFFLPPFWSHLLPPSLPSFLVFLFLFLFGPFVFWGPQSRNMEVPRLGVESELHCRPTPQPQQRELRAASVTYTTAHGNAGFLTHWGRPGIEPETSQFLVGFISAAPQQELPFPVILTRGIFVCLISLLVRILGCKCQKSTSINKKEKEAGKEEGEKSLILAHVTGNWEAQDGPSLSQIQEVKHRCHGPIIFPRVMKYS